MRSNPKPNCCISFHDSKCAIGICDPTRPKVLDFFKLQGWVWGVIQPKPILLYSSFLNRKRHLMICLPELGWCFTVHPSGISGNHPHDALEAPPLPHRPIVPSGYRLQSGDPMHRKIATKSNALIQTTQWAWSKGTRGKWRAQGWMSMTSIDTSILLYSLNPNSIWHEAAVSFYFKAQHRLSFNLELHPYCKRRDFS